MSNDWQKCTSSTLSILPVCRSQSYLDLNGNIVHHFDLTEEHQKLVIEARSVVETSSRVDFDNFPYGVKISSLSKMEGVPQYREAQG